MNDWLEEFEELLDKVINETLGWEFDEFRNKIIDRLNEID